MFDKFCQELFGSYLQLNVWPNNCFLLVYDVNHILRVDKQRWRNFWKISVSRFHQEKVVSYPMFDKFCQELFGSYLQLNVWPNNCFLLVYDVNHFLRVDKQRWRNFWKISVSRFHQEKVVSYPMFDKFCQELFGSYLQLNVWSNNCFLLVYDVNHFLRVDKQQGEISGKYHYLGFIR